MRTSAFVAVSLTFALLAPLPASAWGAGGHRMINNTAIRALPDSLPPFLRTPEAIAELTALGPEADRDKGAGKPRDSDMDPAHYLNPDDDGTIGGTVKLAQLPPSREAYDTALRAGAKPTDEYKVGYLPYEILDGYELVVKDFAIWRADAYAETHVAPADRVFFGNDRRLREILILRDIGYWGHFVGDGSQPLHVSVHFNGWGNYPNPNNYTQSKKIHAKFESDFVDKHTSADAVFPRIPAYVPSKEPVLTEVETYLLATQSHVPQVYQLEGAGAFDAATPAAVNFTLDRLADGAKMFRDLIAQAYVDALDMRVGYPAVPVRDILSGASPPSRSIADGG